MTTSQTTFLSEPVPGERVSLDTYFYWRARAKREAYDLVISEFKKSGITKTELARRLGKKLPEVSRMLGGPANWTISTVSDLLFAITGGIPKWSMILPRRAKRNDTQPHWLTEPDNPLMKIASSSPASNTTHLQLLGRTTEAPDQDQRKFSYGLGARQWK
jgi:hypothetical protein